jgi:hypothetical protein
MPCDCSPSPFDVKSHYHILSIGILSIDILVAFNHSHFMYPRKGITARTGAAGITTAAVTAPTVKLYLRGSPKFSEQFCSIMLS